MFSCCCFKSNTNKNVKTLQVYNKNYLIDKFGQNPEKRQPLSKAQSILKKNHVLSSIPIDSKNFKSSYLQSGLLQSHSKKTILKSNYDDLIKSFKNSEKKWDDPEFPPTASSWGYEDQKPVWKRISEVLPDAKFVQNNFSPSDILQGGIGDCYFLSSLAGLAQKPQRIIKIFPNTLINKNGIYMARIMHKGVFQQVVVDDYFPFKQNGQPFCAKPAGGNEIWVMVLQKCWAKIFGSFKAIEGGYPEEVLRAISSAPTLHFQMVEPYLNDPQFLLSLWQRMMISEKKGYVMCSGSIQGRAKQLDKLGLVCGHAYTILAVYQIPDKIVKLRNPWGTKQWKGRDKHNDQYFWDRISPQIKRKLGYQEENKEDGLFFMLWQDFTNYFDTLEFCNYKDDADYYYQEQKYRNHVPIFYDIELDEGTSTFILAQDSVRSRSLRQNPENIQLNDLTLLLAKIQGKSIEYISSHSSNRKSDLCLTCKDLKAGKYVLVTIIDGVQASIQATFGIYSQNSVTFSKSNAYNYDLINQIFISHASKSTQKQALIQNPQDWFCQGYIQESQFGYSVVHLNPKSDSIFQIEFDEAEYDKGPFCLLPDNRGKRKFKQICRNDKDVAVVCKVYSSEWTEEKNGKSFPIPNIKSSK